MKAQKISLAMILLFTGNLFAQENSFSKPAMTPATGFIENKGQIVDQALHYNPAVKYLFSSPGFNVQLRQDGFSYDTYADTPDSSGAIPFDTRLHFQRPEFFTRNFHRVDVTLAGCNPAAEISAEGRSPGYSSYTINDGASVHAYSYKKVIYRNIYPHIDLEFFTLSISGNNSVPVKYQFVIHPGGNVNAIQLCYKGAEKICLVNDQITLQVKAGKFSEQIPRSYFIPGNEAIKILYKQTGENTFGFLLPVGVTVGSDLVIDPVPNLLWSTYYGGNNEDYCYGSTTDPANNVYISGYTKSTTNIASAGSFQSSYNAGYDAFLAKFDQNGIRLWSTYFGGGGDDYGTGCTTDGSGNIYMAGLTSSTFNIASGGWQAALGGGSWDAFLVKFDTNGNRIWSTYYGGNGPDYGYACATDASGNVFLSGITGSTTNMASAGAWQTLHGGSTWDAFLVKFNSSGNRIWGTYYGGSGDDNGYSCHTDPSGNIFMGGWTTSSANIASVGAYQTIFGGTYDGYVVKFDPAGVRQWGTYYGGSGDDEGYSCSVDASGNVFLTGLTTSASNISSPGSFQPVFGGGAEDAFLVKFDGNGNRQWGTYYGGTGTDNTQSCFAESSGNVILTGSTSSQTYMATSNAWQTTFGGGTYDAFIAQFDPSGNRVWSTFYGGSGDDYGNGCPAGGNGNVYLAGVTPSLSGIATPGSWQPTYGGGTHDAFLAKFSTCNVTASGSQTNVACFGGNNGSATVTVSGGTPGYTYSWSSGGTNATANNLAQGNYTCNITDANGCTTSASVVITQPSVLSASVSSQTNVACNGGNNGSATVTVSGGTSGYTYSWSSGGTNAIENNLAQGNYTCNITDANGCTTSASVVITEPSVLFASASSQTNVACNGGNNGNATVAVSGGTSGYTYSWSSGGTNAIENNLAQGNYTCNITDANGCTTSASVAITQPSVLSASVSSQTNVACNGGNNGGATVAVSGGTSAYTYSWSSGGTNAMENNLTQGNYTCNITDANGCTTSASVAITEPSVLSASVSSQTNVACNGGNNGSATVTVSGGTSAYTYSWSSGGTNATANNLVAGNYTCNITDANGCTTSASITITEPAPIVFSLGNDTTVCSPMTVNFCAPAGFSTYSWNTAQTTQCINAGTSGCYDVTVTDANGCFGHDTICLTVNICTGIADNNSNVFTLYPNPANGSCNIILNNGMQNAVLDLYSSEGKLLDHHIISRNETLDISKYASGIYFIRINNEHTQQLIIQ